LFKREYYNYDELKKKYSEKIFYKEEGEKYLYSTNIVENFNGLIEKERIRLGWYLNSQKIADRIVYLKIEHLHNRVWNKPIPKIASKRYEIFRYV